ncbi:MAG: VTT domain-containing protein [Planctomycetes bacterium]|nr:VTT domain-containing protein [Planctomycetota bacterium]
MGSASHNQNAISRTESPGSIVGANDYSPLPSAGRRQRRAPITASWLVAIPAGALAGWAAWSYFSGGIVAVLLAPGGSAADKVAVIQNYFRSFGVLAPLAYVGIVTIEVVVAPIPGLMLYAPGGMVLGGFWGGLLSLLGNTLGAGIACQLIRALGGKRFTAWLEQGHLKMYQERLSRSGMWLILLLRVNPLTSSDLVSYAAGLAGIPVWKVMFGTLLGLAPLCWAQAYLADGILRAIPQLLYPLLILCGIYGIAAVWIVLHLRGPRD